MSSNNLDQDDPEALRREIAEMRTREAALAAQQELLENLIALARSSPDASMLEATLQKMLDVSTRMTGASSGSLFLLAEDGAVTNSILTRGQATVEQRRAIIGSVMERGLAGWVTRHRQVGLIADTHTDERWFTLPYEPYAHRSALAVPILRGGQLLGILNLLHTDPEHFDAGDAHLMQLAAGQMALALDNARLYAELAESRAQLERWMQARMEETEAAVHDLRHGVHDVLSALDILKLDLFDANVAPPIFQNGVRSLGNALDGMSTLLDDMLDAAKLQHGALALSPAPTDLRALVEQVAQRFEIQCRMFGCTLAISADGPLPLVWCDARRMARVLYNVLHNAVKYSTVRDDGAAGVVTARLTHAGAQVICQVGDNGPGIAPEQLERLGQRFARVAGRSHDVEGTGLGLNFCIGIMTLQGGSFEITSPGPGQGATAILRLPAAQVVREVNDDRASAF
ncbi:MAG TPA: HAMP domain-containing sensor histidine kinase [Roseiflexaceae bacterium]|nr:HAMP domain-containing sensor histidine kinase [Roseiflexaceae bacterium]